MAMGRILSVGLLAFLLVPVAAQAQASTETKTAAQDTVPTRTVLTLSEGWRFRQDDAITGAEVPTFDDSAWEAVAVPHSWNRVGSYLPQVPNRINTPETVNKTMGVGWYRLSFATPANVKDKRVWLEFDAASRIASVWLNGKLLGEHKGGYSRFRLDATDALNASGPNVLAVRTDNTKPAKGSSTADVLPLAGDFFVPGGLYRPVRMIVTHPVHIDMRDHGGPGVYATTRNVTGGVANVDVDIRVHNAGKRNSKLIIRSQLVDASGKSAALSDQSVSIRPGKDSQIRQLLSVANAHLWHGVDDPHLYRLVTEVRTTRGQVLDRVEQPFGIRTIKVDANNGFLLNDKPYALRGVGYHQDREDKGWALAASDVESDVKLLREMGVTSIRLTHYQHGSLIHDIADRTGLILWDEIPLVSQWTFGDAKTASEGLRANARQQLTELIRQNQNHASVAVWGIANEVDFGNSLPGFLTGYTGTPPDPLPLLNELNAHAKALDSSRATTLATCCEGRLFAEGVSVPITAPAADLGGANRYFGWYFGVPQDLAGHLDGLRAARANQPLAVTEYGAGGALTIHTDNVLGGPIDSRGRAQPEAYESYVHETNWDILSKRKDLWATWLWVAFDFASTIRREGDADDINTKGLVAYDHKTRKDAYYFYKANWTNGPTVHINGRRHVNRAYPVTDVRLYSNAPRTTLTVNGTALPVLSDCPQRICVWKAVSLKVGANDIVAHGAFPGSMQEDKITWQVSPDVMRAIRIDSGTMVAAKSASGLFGSDNFFEGGTIGSVIKPANYGKPAVPVVISGTADSEIAATYREGRFGYRLPLANGRYTVTLTFIEPSAAKGARIFNVLADGKVQIKALDIAAAGASASGAFISKFPVTVSGGLLKLDFLPVKGQAIVSSIQIEGNAP